MKVPELPESIIAFAVLELSILQVVYEIFLWPSQARAGGSGGGPPIAPSGKEGPDLHTLDQ